MIHVVARSQEHGDTFVRNHPTLAAHIIIETGQRSYFDLLNNLIQTSKQPYICVVHDDVLLCADFNSRVEDLIRQLDIDWPNWGLVGNAAMLSMRVGYSATDIVRYLSDPRGGPNLAGFILPAQSIDGNVMLLNLRAMRDARIILPSFDGFQLYDIVLSIETIAAGLGVYVAPQLACWHYSKGNQGEFDRSRVADAFNKYLLLRLRNRSIKTLDGPHRIPLGEANPIARVGLDLDMDSLRSAMCGRHKKKVAIVIRTQFARLSLLRRTLDTVGSFIAFAGLSTEFSSYIVTDSETTAPDWVVRRSMVLRANFPHDGDSRYQLVRFAAENIEADYFWFVDDDDFILPNEAERLSLVISASPRSSIIFIDCQYFNERPLFSKTPEDASGYRSAEGCYFVARNFLASLSGQNHTPFCGALFDRSVLLKIPSCAYDKITYYEDYITILIAILAQNCFPIIIDKLFVGISLRESGNTVTEKDRLKWDKSMSELVSCLVNLPEISHMLSLPSSSFTSPHEEPESFLGRCMTKIKSLGFRNTMNKAWGVFKREGWIGVRNRVKF
jgi:GR25 family glycosyltransferase involved in LPS biosynthesis